MTTSKRTVTLPKARRAARQVQHVVRTTVGDLIASLVDTFGADGARELLLARSPLQKALRQRLVLSAGEA